MVWNWMPNGMRLDARVKGLDARVKGLNALCEGTECPVRRDWMPWTLSPSPRSPVWSLTSGGILALLTCSV